MKKALFFLMFVTFNALADDKSPIDLNKYFIRATGKINPSKTLEFSSCLLDAFDNAHGVGSNIHFRQQIRREGYRVEGLVGFPILIRADILNSGDIVLYEAKAAAFINTQGEREGFNSCLAEYVLK